MSACKKVLECLPWFVGDDLDAVRAEEVRAHLHTCASCRREASSLQQSVKTLRRFGAAELPVVDEAMFAAMHASVLAEVDGQLVRADAGARAGWADHLRRWPVSVAAAAVLFVAGWWVVPSSGPPSLLDRQPIATSVGYAGPAKAVPWSGGRVEMRPLGDEWTSGEGAVENGLGPGMMGRWRLRTLEDIELVVPIQPPAKR